MTRTGWVHLRQRQLYSIQVATDKECDIFRCEENGLLYVPGKNELFIYHEPKQKKRNSIADALSQSRNITDITGISSGRQSSAPER